MAVIHISEEEAARDLHAVLEKVRAGQDVVIRTESDGVRLVVDSPELIDPLVPRFTKPRLITEMIAELRENSSGATLDGDFERDLMAVVQSHEQEGAFDPWADF